jgi:anti-sigma-K factor RskA
MDDLHITFQENLSAYALGALDANETITLENHLQTCEPCRAELADYQRISAGLLSALPPQSPRPALKRILQKRLETPRPQIKFSFSQIAITGAFILLLALNIVSLLQIYSLKQQQAELNSQHYSEQTAISMLAYPGAQPITFDQNGISGSLLVDTNRNLLAVFAWHLPPAPAGKTYQMWLMDAKGNRTSGGFLAPDTDQLFVMAVIASPGPLTNFTGLGVTLEPSGGSPAPTGPRVLHVSF